MNILLSWKEQVWTQELCEAGRSRAETTDYFHCQFDIFSQFQTFYRPINESLKKRGKEKLQPVFPKAQDNVLKCLISPTT